MSKRRKFTAESKRGRLRRPASLASDAKGALELGIRASLLTAGSGRHRAPERSLLAAPGRHGTRSWLVSSPSWRVPPPPQLLKQPKVTKRMPVLASKST